MGSNIQRLQNGYKTRLVTINPHLRTLYIFNALSLVGSIVYGLYYGVFLYKQTFSLSVLAIDGLLGGLGCWLGYVAGVMVVRRFGYGRGLKLAFGIWAAVCFVTALLANNIADWFMLLAVLKAFPGGMYAATTDTIMLRDIRRTARSNFLQVKLTFEFLASVVLPSLVGALISFTAGYQLAFVLAGAVYLLALFVPVRLPRPRLSLDIGEIGRTFRRPLYVRHAANRTAAAGFNQLNAFVAMIIPFLLLQDELKVGLLASIIALLAGAVSLLVRRVQPQSRLAFGYAAYAVRALGSLSFVAFWSAPVLMLWQLVNKLATPFHDPLQQDLDIRNDSLIMGSDVREKALHINILNNTLQLFGTMAAYGCFFLIVQAGADQQRMLLPILIMSFAVWRFINLALSVRIIKQALGLSAVVPAMPERLPLGLALRQALRERFARFQLLLDRS